MRPPTTIAAICAVLACAVPGGLRAQPAPAAGPVTISSCVGGLTSVELIEIANYDVILRNNGGAAADEVRLSVRYGKRGKRATFVLKDAIAAGADVSRHLHRTVNGGLYAYWSDHNDCFVDYVHFTNGTSWTRPPETR